MLEVGTDYHGAIPENRETPAKRGRGDTWHAYRTELADSPGGDTARPRTATLCGHVVPESTLEGAAWPFGRRLVGTALHNTGAGRTCVGCYRIVSGQQPAVSVADAKRVVLSLNSVVEDQEASGARPAAPRPRPGLADAAIDAAIAEGQEGRRFDAAHAAGDDGGEDGGEDAPDLEQLSLLPPSPPLVREVRIALAELPPDSDLIGVVRDSRFDKVRESIRMLGMLSPIVLTRRNNRWDLGDGRRRLVIARELAEEVGEERARALGISPIRAYEVWSEDGNVGPWEDVLPIILNAQRSPNRASDVQSIARLQAKGYDADAIARASGLSAKQVEKLGSLLRLPRPLLQAFYAGKLKPSSAAGIITLPDEAISRLLAHWHAHGALTAEDVAVERQRVAAERLEAVQAALGLDVESPAPAPGWTPAPEDESGLAAEREELAETLLGSLAESIQDAVPPDVAVTRAGDHSGFTLQLSPTRRAHVYLVVTFETLDEDPAAAAGGEEEGPGE